MIRRFFFGIRCLGSGIAFVCGRPRNWGYAAIPAAIATTLGTIVMVSAYFLIALLVNKLFGVDPTGLKLVLAWLVRILCVPLGFLLSIAVALSLAQPLSGFALDELCRRKEQELTGIIWAPKPGGFVRALKATLIGLTFVITVVGSLSLVSFAFAPAAVITVPLKVMASALAIAWDMLDYPLGQKGVGIGKRVAFIRKNFAEVLGFALACAVSLLIPGLGILMLPVGVVGATVLASKLAQDEEAREPALLAEGQAVPALPTQQSRAVPSRHPP
jgi:uncharacterized protein involved in cysteine biosynthesis